MNFNKKAFTLLEIVVVLFIMGSIYTLGMSSFSKKTFYEDNYHFDLRSFLQNGLNIYDKKVELIVMDDITIVRINDDKKTDVRFALPKNILFYSYWNDGTQKEYFKPYFEDGFFKDVKFRYSVFPNKVSTKCIVKKNGRFHIQSNYFKDDSIFDELHEAQEYLLKSDIKDTSKIADD